MDHIRIEDLRIETVIGVYDWEREIRQVVALDVTLPADIAAAAARDEIDATIDYKAVAKRLIALVEASRCQLIETLAERCAALILDEFDVPWVRLSVRKPGAVTGARDVGVVIERRR